MGILSSFRFAFQNVFFTPVLYGVIASLAIFSATWEKGDRLKDQLTDPFRSQQDTFDFVIVGGGSAGAVLAYRLSKYHTVLLLEAGGESHPFQAIPALSLFIPNYPATDWSHKSVKQTTSCLACVDKRYTFSQGKNLGGSGNLNYLIHLRGSYKDYDNWARITGDPKWSYDGVLKDFIISENFVGTSTDYNARGVGGPLQIELPTEIGLANEWNAAGQEMGYQRVDLNGKYEEGFDAVYYPIKRGIRQATYRAFIQPVRHRGSLLIRKFSHVNKVLIREGTSFAYGVQYDRHGQSCNAFANKEVILSAGALQTPKILMLSGVGPRAILEPCGIPIRSDLPVGKGLQDHISTLLGPFYINSPKTFSYDEDVSTGSFFQFMQKGTGPLSTSGFQATALLTSNLAKARGQEGWPDIQLTLLGLTPHRLFNSDMAHAFGLKEDTLRRFFGDAGRGEPAFFIVVTVARPESRGEVCIQSKNPYKPLIIDPKYYSDPDNKDMSVMIEGIHRALHLAENTTVFQSCDVRLLEKCFPGCEGHVYRSDGYWECYARHLTITLNDHVGTAQMGYKDSPYAVVDSDLKVMGVPFLRVVDGSVIPTIVGANTQAATIMIAEKASSLILQDWADSAVNYDLKERPVYGPPPDECCRQPPPLRSEGGYGTPSTLEEGYGTPSTGTDSPNYVIAVGTLTPPGVSNPDHSYNNYDSFDVLRNKGEDTIQINLHGETNNPSDKTFSSPSPYPTETTVYTFPPTTTPEDLFSKSPPLYQEIYDPTTPNPTSPSSSLRSGKVYDFGDVLPPENFLENDPDSVTATSASVPSTSEDSILTRGPNGSSLILRKRKKRPPQVPNVTVHPRGHLGLEDGDRTPGIKSTSPIPPSYSSTSVQPLPTNYVVIKQRRPPLPPRVRRKRPVGSNNGPQVTAHNVLEDPVRSESPISITTPIIPLAEEGGQYQKLDRRLRNFIPVRGKRGHATKTEKMPSLSSTTPIIDDNTTDNSVDDVDVDVETTTDTMEEGEATTEADVDNELKMVVLDNILLELKKVGGTSATVTTIRDYAKRRRKNREVSSPIVPMDMNPLPKIIASTSATPTTSSPSSSMTRHNYINISNNYSKVAKNSPPISRRKIVNLNNRLMTAEERKVKMAKFVRTTH